MRDLHCPTASPKRKFCHRCTHEHFDCNQKNHEQEIREIQPPECNCDDTAWQQAKTREYSLMRFCEDADANSHKHSDNGTNHVSSESRRRFFLSTFPYRLNSKDLSRKRRSFLMKQKSD